MSANSELARALCEEIRQSYLPGYVEGSDGRCYKIFPIAYPRARGLSRKRMFICEADINAGNRNGVGDVDPPHPAACSLKAAAASGPT